METIVISIGGSVLLSSEANHSFFTNLVDLLTKLSKRYKLYVVVGGGKTAREYISIGRSLQLTEESLDTIGIAITRVNASLLSSLIKDANTDIPTTTDEAKEIDASIVIMGGTTPGHSTDMVGAELAKKVHAHRFVIATNVNGVYNKDPNKFADAVHLPEISIDELLDTYGTTWTAAGSNVVIDGPALQIMKQTKIPTAVVNGKRLDQLERAITGQSFEGTEITI